ncbi:MAG: methyltransferase domain-containing protein [Pseudomonadota bacterium]
MSNPPKLTDRRALALHRARAHAAPVTFLQAEAAAQVSERLIEVNKSFTSAAVVGPMAGFWQNALADLADFSAIDDNETIDLQPASLDLLVHALALHWADDPVGQLVQMRRALRPDGLMIAILFGDLTLHELRSSLASAEVALRGGLSSRVAPMGELRDLGGLLQRAGFALPVADRSRTTVSYADMFALIRDLRAMGETNALHSRDRRVVSRELFSRAAQVYARSFPADGNRISATFDLVYLTGWAPAADQPRPLRPGSATTRLADALGTTELRSGDATVRPGKGN